VKLLSLLVLLEKGKGEGPRYDGCQ